jgi:hypothetical protein
MMFIVQNWGQHPQYIYTTDNTKSMTYTSMASDVGHNKKLQSLQDTKRVAPKLWACQPPSVAYPPTDPLHEPLNSYVSNEIGFPAHFEGLYVLLLLPPHLPSASDDVVEACLIVMDLHLDKHHFLS